MSAASPASPVGADETGQAPTYTHKQIMLVLSGLLAGMFLAALDQTVVATAMRTIADELQGQTAQAWVTTSYLITSTVSTPLYGKLSDTYGRKPFYLAAIVIFMVGSLLCGTAGDIYTLAAYRAVQGLGAGGLLSLAFAIVGDMVPPRERGRYQAWFMGVFGCASVLGPVVGGVLAGQDALLGIDGWRWIFYVNVPVGLVALLVVSKRLDLPRRHGSGRIDLLGAALLTVAVVPVLVLAEQGHTWGWTSPRAFAMVGLSGLALAAFVPWERRLGDEAILPLRVFSSRVFSLTSVLAVLVGAAMFGALVLIPLYFQIVRGYGPTAAGLLMLPVMAGIFVSGFTSARVMSRTGRYKVFPVLGTAVMFVGVLLLSRLGVDTPMPLVLATVAAVGVGLGLCMQTMIIAVQNALPPSDMGVATGSVTFFRSLGGTLGAAVSLAVVFGTLMASIRERAVAADLPAAVVARFSEASALDDTTIIATLPDAVQRVVLQGFADAMSGAFLLVSVLLVPAFVLALRVEELPLRGGPAVARERAATPESAVL